MGGRHKIRRTTRTTSFMVFSLVFVPKGRERRATCGDDLALFVWCVLLRCCVAIFEMVQKMLTVPDWIIKSHVAGYKGPLFLPLSLLVRKTTKHSETQRSVGPCCGNNPSYSLNGCLVPVHFT